MSKDKVLRELAEDWRNQAKDCDSVYPLTAGTLYECANELDAALDTVEQERILGNQEPSKPIEYFSSPAVEQVHGVNCQKVPHTQTGYLHGEDDDTPYDVDGLSYCGRCHAAISTKGAL